MSRNTVDEEYFLAIIEAPVTDKVELSALLRSGRPLDPSSLPRAEGRTIVKGLRFDRPSVTGRCEAAGVELERTTGNTILEEIIWRDIEFRNCDLSHAKFFKCELTNCVFRRCKCLEIGFWESQLTGVQFCGTNLRDSALGGVDTLGVHVPNHFVDVSFVGCDLRGSAHSCETYTGCRFNDCRLSTVDFHGAVFTNCVFEGKLDVVTFRSIDPSCSDMKPNLLEGCDFRKARLHACSFLNINLDKINPPEDSGILMLTRGPDDLRLWRVRLGKSNVLLEDLIENAGTPTLIETSFLAGLYTQEELGWLRDIAAAGTGSPPSL